MVRTLIFFSLFWLIMLFSLIFLIPLVLFKIIGTAKIAKAYARSVTARWSKLVLNIAGIRVNSISPVPFPPGPFVIVSNHQGYFDIPLIISELPVSPAFISKKELKKIPLFNLWMDAMDTLFIDRSDSSGSRKKIMKRLQEKNRNPLLLFPEGTRSRKNELLHFKTGGLKMVFDSSTDVLPVKIDNTYKCWEEKGRIRPVEVNIEVMPLILAKDYREKGFNDFVKQIREKLTVYTEPVEV